jgi:acylphosphatase
VIARRVTVAGQVQGVGFRFFAARSAREAGVTGWVRNLPDGRVESVAEGEEGAVARYLDRMREGPRMGRVTDVRVEEVSITGFDAFEIST